MCVFFKHGLFALSVVFFALWMMIIYVFALVLRQLTEGQTVGMQPLAGKPARNATLGVTLFTR